MRQSGVGGPEIRHRCSDAVDTSGVLNKGNSQWSADADFKPEFCGKPRRHSNQMKHAPSPRASRPLVWSVCSVRCLYGVPCKPRFERFCISLRVASWNLWLLVHYRGNPSSKVGTTSLQAVNTRQLASRVPDYRMCEGHLRGHTDEWMECLEREGLHFVSKLTFYGIRGVKKPTHK